MAAVLVIDDDPDVLAVLRAAVERRGDSFHDAGDVAGGIERFSRSRPDVVFCDLFLGGAKGFDFLARLHDIDPRVPVVIITGEQSSDLAILSNARGAFDYLSKPLNPASVDYVIDQAVAAAAAARRPIALAPAGERLPPGTIVGRCPAMQEVYRSIGRVAARRVTVLLLGESGTGKELVARAIHQHSGREGRPYVVVNCASVPENLLESELFGHEKGAYTGADRRREGRFEQADGGTLFLDEVGELSLDTQAKLLRVLQQQEFQRVGGSETLRTDARVVAATNRDLNGMVAEGRFRSDLYFRLAGYSISLPPLRERGDDLPALIRHFLSLLGDELGMTVSGLCEEAVDLLTAHPWPGNLRELEGSLRRAMLRSTGPVLTPDLFDLRPSGPVPPPARRSCPDKTEFVSARLAAGTRNLYAEWLASREPELFRHVLTHFKWNLTQAAEALGINRMTLRGRIREYDLHAPAESE